ncbi:MAG: PAS domain-containing protein [bacterium]
MPIKKNNFNIQKQVIPSGPIESICLEEMQQMLHKLHNHQIELEKHTKELLQVQTEVEDLRNRSEEIIISHLTEITSYYDNAPIGLAILDTNLRFMRINKILAEMNGVPASEYIGKTVSEMLPLYKEQAESATSTILTTGKPVTGIEISGEITMQPGVRHVWMAGLYPLKTNNEIVGFTVIVEDITEHRRIEEALKQNEIELSGILDSTADGILAVDNYGKVIRTNQRFAEMWHIPKSLLNKGNDQQLLDFVLQQLSSPEAFLQKVKMLYDSVDTDLDMLFFKDGRIFERYSAPLKNSSLIGRVWSFRDVTASKQAEETLLFQSEVLSEIVEGVSLVQASDLTIIYTNSRFDAMFGYNPGELIGKHVSILNAPFEKNSNEIIKMILDATIDGNVWEGDIQSITKDAQTFWSHMSVHCFEHPKYGQVFISVQRDVTERKKAVEILKNYNAELEKQVVERTFLAENRAQKLHLLSKQMIRAEEKERKRIAYILHTEVQQILVAAQLALKTGIRKVDDIATLKSLTAVDKMLKEALSETRELVHEIVPPVLREGGLREAILWLSHQIRIRHDFSVHVESDDNYLDLDDEVSICAYQSIRELLLNVYKHANVKKAEVTLKLVDENRFCVTVHDKGIGFISAEKSKPKNSKSGFGLYSIREQVEGLGGSMDINSTLGEGTSISIILPLKKKKERKVKEKNGKERIKKARKGNK